MLKINVENPILALFEVYLWPFNKSHEKINVIFVISASMASIWNVFIKFRWHDENLTEVSYISTFISPIHNIHIKSGTISIKYKKVYERKLYVFHVLLIYSQYKGT